MSIADLNKVKKTDMDYWQKSMSKVYNKAHNFCLHDCKQRETSDFSWCSEYWYERFMVPKKIALHQFQDSQQNAFVDCISRSGSPGDLKTIFDCTNHTTKAAMLIAADNIEKVWDEVLSKVL